MFAQATRQRGLPGQDFPIHFKLKWKISSAYPGVNSNSSWTAILIMTFRPC